MTGAVVMIADQTQLNGLGHSASKLTVTFDRFFAHILRTASVGLRSCAKR